MADDLTPSISSGGQPESNGRSLASAALILAGVPFVIGGIIVIYTDTPPSGSPTLGMLSHALWALAVALLALGVVTLLRWTPPLRRGLAGYLSAGILGLGVLHGLQWLTWAYVDVRGEAEGEHELVVDSIIVPFGAGHLLVYAILVGAGVACFGWALARTTLVSRSVALTGVVLGSLTAVLAVIPLVAAVGGGSDGHVVFDAATLLVPVVYLWALGVGVTLARS